MDDESKYDLPGVSVITPFLDNHEDVARLVNELLNQSYPQERVEIICIDNGSATSLQSSPEWKGKVRLLKEHNYVRSPYSARNRGIEASKGDAVVFLDANSRIPENWLENGVRQLLSEECDLLAGKVSFDYGDRVTSAKIADALTSIKMKQAVEERGVAYTANLFVWKKVFDDLGCFEEGARSGGDVRWTGNATRNGYRLIYDESTEVFKFARSAKGLYRKKMRTGRGYLYTWLSEKDRKSLFYNFIKSFKPPSVKKVIAQNPDRFYPGFIPKKPGIWMHLYLTGIAEQVSFLAEFVRFKIKGNDQPAGRIKSMTEGKTKLR